MRLTYSLILTFALCSSPIFATAAQSDGLTPVLDFRDEAKESKQKKAPILVLFMSPYCPYCETALNNFLLPMQRNPEYQNKVILRQLDIYNKDKLIDFRGNTTTPLGFANQAKVWAVPTVILFDSEGRELKNLTGLLTVDYYRFYLDEAIEQAIATIKAQTHH
jgi:thioredoxin-related protein